MSDSESDYQIKKTSFRALNAPTRISVFTPSLNSQLNLPRTKLISPHCHTTLKAPFSFNSPSLYFFTITSNPDDVHLQPIRTSPPVHGPTHPPINRTLNNRIPSPSESSTPIHASQRATRDAECPFCRHGEFGEDDGRSGGICKGFGRVDGGVVSFFDVFSID